jgi:hypothetical protein
MNVIVYCLIKQRKGLLMDCECPSEDPTVLPGKVRPSPHVCIVSRYSPEVKTWNAEYLMHGYELMSMQV